MSRVGIEVPRWLGASRRETARAMRKAPTASEHNLWQALRSRQLGVKFRRQHPVGPFIVDFYCAARNLVVEVDGSVHAAQENEDRRRQRFLEELGLRVLRLRAVDVENRLEAAVAKVRAALEHSDPIPREVPPSVDATRR